MEEAMTNRLMLVDPSVGRAWVNDSLASGGSLSQHFLAIADLERGRVQAVLPTGEDADHPERGFGSRDASTTLLYAFLRESHEADAQLVVEDELLRRTDYNDLRRFGTPVVFCGDEVFHVQSLRAFDTSASLEEFLNWSSAGHPLNAFLIGADGLDRSTWNGAADRAAVERFAKNVRLVVVGAYDSDGFLVWSPDS